MPYIKIVQSGDLIEKYSYERSPSPKRLLKKSSERILTDIQRANRALHGRRDTSVVRAKKSFRRLVRSNLLGERPHLLTLTMLDIVPIESAYVCFTAFGQRLRKFYRAPLAWVSVPEFQKRGAVHFHVLVWGLPYDEATTERATRRIQNLWGYGYVDLVPTDGSPKIASYLAKYMSKSMSDLRLSGKKAYCSSRNLLRPVSTAIASEVDALSAEWGLDVDISPQVERSYGTLFLGRCEFKSYSLKK